MDCTMVAGAPMLPAGYVVKMIYRTLPKTASLPVTCHPLRTDEFVIGWDGNDTKP
jgi:hypothetical protein